MGHLLTQTGARRALGRILAALIAGLLALTIATAAFGDTKKIEAPLDRSTPRKTVEGFQRAIAAKDFEKAAQCLDARGISNKPGEAAARAEKLGLVLAWKLVLHPDDVSDNLEGDPADGPEADIVGRVTIDGDDIPIALTRSRAVDGSWIWRFSKTTVSFVPMLEEAREKFWLGDKVPHVLTTFSVLGIAAWQWLGLLLAILLSYAVGHAVGSIITAIATRFVRRSKVDWDDKLVATGRGPLRLGLGLAAFANVVDQLQLNASAQLAIDNVRNSIVILTIAWMIIRVIDLSTHSLVGRLPEDTAGEMKSRGVRTQLAVIRRVLSALVGIVALAAMLTQFEIVRTVGTSLLASAGIAGVVLGIAAQKTLGGVFAGLQVSLAQPIRIGDAVRTEGEFGTIEEIKFTYVVVRLWDERRLIVPTARFLEQPFENWTRMGAEIQGAVFLPVDHRTPVEAVRAELTRICTDDPAWDGRACSLIVHEANEQSIMLRAVVSAANHHKCWDLRCRVREQLVTFLQGLDGGAYLPRRRIEGATDPSVTKDGDS